MRSLYPHWHQDPDVQPVEGSKNPPLIKFLYSISPPDQRFYCVMLNRETKHYNPHEGMINCRDVVLYCIIYI